MTLKKETAVCIKNFKTLKYEQTGLSCSFVLQRIAKSLNMSQKKVRNATEVTESLRATWSSYIECNILLSICSLCIYISQAISKVFSLDREAFPSLNGLPGDTHHCVSVDWYCSTSPSRKIIRTAFFTPLPFFFFHQKYQLLILFIFPLQYIADNRLENIPWHGVDEWTLKVFWKISEWNLT